MFQVNESSRPATPRCRLAAGSGTERKWRGEWRSFLLTKPDSNPRITSRRKIRSAAEVTTTARRIDAELQIIIVLGRKHQVEQTRLRPNSGRVTTALRREGSSKSNELHATPVGSRPR
jgi:hypothetical protein